MALKRKICVVTGTRAEYGLLYWLMKDIQSDAELELQLVVTGMHLSPEFGFTYQAIVADGFTIDAKVEMLLSSDSEVGVAKSMGLGLIGFADAFARLKPDLVVVLGDRYEIFAAAQAAMVAKIPIAHIHGGELTEGLIDEAIRHSITKMAHLHFVAAQPYRQRVIQLGESPDRVFNFGAPAVDNIQKVNLLTREELEQQLDFRFGRQNFLVTYHPVTLAAEGPEKAVQALLQAIDDFPEARVIFTRPNADTNGRIINRILDDYSSRQRGRVAVYTSLGQRGYLSAVRQVDAVIGNSSSGLIEVPVLRKPTVNIGPRQQGRLRADSVIDCDETYEGIRRAINRALSSEFKKIVENTVSPYGAGNACRQIKQVLKAVQLEGILGKRFYDLGDVT